MTVVWAGLVAAVAALGATFRGPADRFWSRMTWTGAGLGALAVLANPGSRRPRASLGGTAAGIGFAGVLYLGFEAGNVFARRFVPGAGREIRAIHAWRTLRPAPEIALRLAIVIGPGEELFWRGLVQDRLTRRYGRWPAAALATLAYSAAHVVAGKVMLVGAAAAGGACWSGLRAAGAPMSTLIVSHVAWDLWVFLLWPIGDTSPADVARGDR